MVKSLSLTLGTFTLADFFYRHVGGLMILKSKNRKIIFCFSKTIDKSEAFAITSINTTLISLIAACILAYVVFIYTSIQDAELKAFDEANKINNILFAVHDCPFRISEKSDVFDKAKLIKIIHHISLLGSIAGNIEINEEYKALSLPKDVDALSEKALGVMSCLVGQYPFPVIISKTEKNQYQFDRESKPIIFANLDELRSWVDSMNVIIHAFTSEFRGTGKLLELLTEFGKGDFVNSQKKAMMEYSTTSTMLLKPMLRGSGRPFITMEALDPVAVYNDFMDKLAEAQNIVWSTSNYIRRIDAQTIGYPSKVLLCLSLVFVVVAFVFGVIYPLVAEKVSRMWALGLPLLIYIVIGILIIPKFFL